MCSVDKMVKVPEELVQGVGYWREERGVWGVSFGKVEHCSQ